MRAQSLERKPYPSLAAISNVFQLAVRRDPEIAGFNPWLCGIPISCANSTIADISIGCTNKKGGA